jgi:hypothetical protein
LPCSVEQRPTRSFACARAFDDVASAPSVPEDAEEVDPARERVGDGLEDESRRAGAVDVDRGGRFAGEGTPSTSRSSSAVVPRFFVATPHATGNSSPRVTASLSACATSSRAELLAVEVALHQPSSVSTTESSSCVRYCSTVSCSSAGSRSGPLALALGAA